MALDNQISGAFGLLALLLVFVIGYFAAFFPNVQDLLDKPIPDIGAERMALAGRLRAYRALMWLVLLLTVLTAIVLAPLTRRVLVAISFSGPFPTIKAGLLLVDVMLLALLVLVIWLIVKIGQRIRVLRRLINQAAV
jgi:hypothetical protein